MLSPAELSAIHAVAREIDTRAQALPAGRVRDGLEMMHAGLSLILVGELTVTR